VVRLASSALCTSWSAANHKRVCSYQVIMNQEWIPHYLPTYHTQGSSVLQIQICCWTGPNCCCQSRKSLGKSWGERETQRDRNRNRDRSRLQGWGLGFVLSKWVFHGRVAGNFWLGTGEPHLNKAKIQGLKKLKQIEEIPTPHERWVLLHGKKKESSSYVVKFAECQIEETNKLCV